MEINHLREFITFSETMNFTLAAKKLFVAKSTLIQHIRNIENELGFKIIDPSNPHELTEQGNIFLFRIQKLLADYDKLIKECSSNSEPIDPDKVRILCYPPDPFFFDTGIPVEFLSNLAFLSYNEFDALKKCSVDVVLSYSSKEAEPRIPEGVDGSLFEIVPLPPERCIFAMSKKHPLATCDSMTQAPQEEWSFIAAGLPCYESSISSIREQLEKYGIVNTYILVRPNTIRQLLSADEECLCIAHESAVESLLADSNNDIVIKEFSDIPIVLQRFAVALKGNKNPFVHEFMQALSTPQRTSAPQGVAHAMS